MGRKSTATVEAEKREAEARFNEAVANKVGETVSTLVPNLVTQIMQQISVATPAPVAPSFDGGPIDLGEQGTLDLRKGGDDKSFAENLALAIASLHNQGTGKPEFVPPDVLNRRAEAHERMIKLLVQARAEGQLPVYRVMKTVFFNETRIEPQWHDPATKAMRDTQIKWDEIPNRDLEPVNELAVQVFAEFLGSIGETPDKRKVFDTTWVRSEKRLFKGMTQEERASVYGASPMDLRVEGHGAPVAGKRQHLLGTVAPPAVVR